MKIEQHLPFECCNDCPEFILDVNEQVYFSMEHTMRIIKVGCKNERICFKLKKNLIKMGDKKDDNA